MSLKILSFSCFKTKHYFLRQYSSVFAMEHPIVNIKDGKLRGSTAKLFNGSSYYSFKGIPYAEPPLGNLRFKAPLPIKPWEGIKDAVEHGPICPQLDVQTRKFTEDSEDCLFLNVYTQAIETTCKKPVMVFIHGGGFMSGSGNCDLFGPEFLVQHDVVLVTINYRLEVLGFLCLDIPEAPGNAGMKDQVLALRWVQNNIHKFGGDPKNVTIFGESAGAASVTYHMASPLSRGLFHKAISQSGVCNAMWAQGADYKSRAYRLCKLLGKDTSDPYEALEFLKNVPAKDLVGKTFKTLTPDEKYRGLPLHFCPNVEQSYPGIEAFLPECVENVLLSGRMEKVPLMIGYNSKEGILVLPNELRKLEYRQKHLSSYLPRDMLLTVNQSVLEEMGKRIKEFYFGEKEISADENDIMSDLQTDLLFTYPIHLFTEMYARYSQPIYMYRFNFDTELNILKSLVGFSDIKGAAHADELFYMFCNVMVRDLYEENEKLRNIVNDITKLWTDFAKTGNPTANFSLQWNPYTIKDKEYLVLDENMCMRKFADRERVQFWSKLYKQTNLPHVVKSNL